MSAPLVFVAAVYGLLFGSFLNAWAWRLAHDESIGKGRSHCTSCGAPIRARDNIPVVSWLLLRGHCRDCGVRISWRYPVGEVVTAALFAAVAAYDGLSWVLVPHLIFVSVMVLVSEVDLEIRIIPDVVILPAAAIGLVLMILIEPAEWMQWVVAGVGAALFLLTAALLYEKLRGVAGMGMGDVKMALCMGFFLGVAVVPALFLGFVMGAVIGVVLVWRVGGGGKTAIPFGPFLASGAIIALFLGQPAIDLYLDSFLR
ncbi:MAG TPA: A24 family peptidase [Thermoleophilia bacterium]|nr:A24 family peptidase [Thermoleophilia bacterium]